MQQSQSVTLVPWWVWGELVWGQLVWGQPLWYRALLVWVAVRATRPTQCFF